MTIDNARRDVQTFAVNNRRAGWSFHSVADSGDLSVGHEKVRVLQCALRAGSPNGRALDENRVRLLRRRDASERTSRISLRKIEWLIQRRRFLILFLFWRVGGRALGAPANHGASRSFAATLDRSAGNPARKANRAL